MEEKTFIAFMDDDDRKKEDWVNIKDKTTSYVSFEYKGKLVTIPWHRVLKLKELVTIPLHEVLKLKEDGHD